MAARERDLPGHHGLGGVAGPDDHQVRHRAERRQVLDRLVRRPVLPDPDRVVRPDVHDGQLGERRQPHRRAHVVGEDEERAAEHEEPAVVGDAVGDRAHRVLAHAEVEVPPLGRAAEERPRRLHERLGRRGEVGVAAHQVRQPRGHGREHGAARVAGGHRRVRREAREILVPARGERPRLRVVPLGREVREGLAPGVEAPAPVGLHPRPAGEGLTEAPERRAPEGGTTARAASRGPASRRGAPRRPAARRGPRGFRPSSAPRSRSPSARR